MTTTVYMTMQELGRLFGTTSHQIGRKLKDLGLRTADGRPSRTAFHGGYCDQRWTRDRQHYCWAWHAEKTCEALRRAGLEAGEDRDRPPDAPQLPGPPHRPPA